MAALEYLTENSLTAHPFKVRKGESLLNQYSVSSGWFYDILFVSLADDIRSVFISSIVKDEYGDAYITFSNVESGEPLEVAHIVSSQVVDHYNNKYSSFAYFSCSKFLVKFLFGLTFVQLPIFSQSYTADETTLSSSAVILNAPRIDSLLFEAYDSRISNNPIEIHTYSYPEVPTVKTNHNTAFVLESLNHGGLYVTRGAGAGLYDDCPVPGDITDVYSINSITPDLKGALFFNASSCYTADTLSENTANLLGAYVPGGYLYDYHTFKTHTTESTYTYFDAVSVGHSIVLQNFCKPKCPHENLNAFAHYLNRVTDGATELDRSISTSTETRGKGIPSQTDPLVFEASAFCLEDDQTFTRCADPLIPESYISCSSNFIKYYHEGRTLQLYYDALTIRSFTIVEVLDDFRVRLDVPPTQTATELPFRLLDNGVFSNINCAASAYNLDSLANKNPYYKVKYTTTEAFNTEGVYVTYLSIVVAIFNPSPNVATLDVVFGNPVKLTQQGVFKIRKNSGIINSATSDVTLGCREYAFLEAVYFIPCGVTGGALDIVVFQQEGEDTVQIGDTFALHNISGTDCPGTLTGQTEKIKITQAQQTVAKVISLPKHTSSVKIYGNFPEWLGYTPNYTASTLTLALTNPPSDNVSTRYNSYFRSYGGAIPGTITQLIIDYIAAPVIISPLAASHTETSPIVVSKSTIYSDESPLIQISAANMLPLSYDYPEDSAQYYYTAETLPEGLVLDASTGKITGRAQTIERGGEFSVSLTAHNPAGSSLVQLVHFYVALDSTPEVTLSPSTPSVEVDDFNVSVFSTNNLNTHTLGSPLVALTASNPPIYRYGLEGDLPDGLEFDAAAGKVIGRATGKDLATDSSSFFQVSIYAVNYYGQSLSFPLSIKYTSTSFAPEIKNPSDGAFVGVKITDSSTKEFPTLIVKATQADGQLVNYSDCAEVFHRNVYTALGLPPGLVLDSCTGELYGTIDQTQLPASALAGDAYYQKYSAIIYANNPVGESQILLYFIVYSSGRPVINNISSGKVLTASRTLGYTKDYPLFKIAALNSPTSYAADNLPSGLSCLSTGELVGSIAAGESANNYPASLCATNEAGTACIDCVIAVPVSISLNNPPTVGAYPTYLDREYSPLLTFSVTDIPEDDSLVISTTQLPTGLTLQNRAIVGRVNATFAPGIYNVTITATTRKYGSASVPFSLAVREKAFKASGVVRDTDDNPISEVSLLIAEVVVASTDEYGYYTIPDLYTGSYNVQASKAGYLFIPRYNAVQIYNQDKYNVNFVGEGPLKLVTGTITSTDDNSPVANITVSDGKHTAATSSFGVYELYVDPAKTAVVVPQSSSYAFSPAEANIASGNVAVTGVDFTAQQALVLSAPEISSVDSNDSSLTINFKPLSSSLITTYQYSTDAGVTWLNRTPVSVTSPIVIDNLVNGTQYRLRIRAVADLIAGDPTNSVYATPSGKPTAPGNVSVLAGNKQIKILFNTPSSDGGSAITNYQYSLDAGDNWVDRVPISNASPVLVTGLTNGVTYLVQLRAITAAAEGAASETVSVLPSDYAAAPKIKSIGVSDSSLLVYFDPPTDTGGAPITNYAYSVDGWVTYKIPTEPSITAPLTISGLYNGTLYNVYIAAITSVGIGYVSNGLTATPKAVPAAPSNLSSVVGDGTASIFFKAPSDNGSSMTDYEYSIDSADFVSAGVITSPVSLSGLVNDSHYSVVIRAVNAAGKGVSSAAIVVTPEKDIFPPSNPLHLAASTSVNNTISLSFDPPSYVGNAVVQNYEYNLNGSQTWITPSPAVTSSPLVISGLTGGTTYSVALRAVNKAGAGVQTAAITATPLGVPAAPTNLRITPGNKTLTVTFTAGNNGGAAIINYAYSLDSPEHSLFRYAGVTSSPIVITKDYSGNALVNGTNYGVTIRATNARGTGISSSEVFAKPSTLPEPPTNLTVSVGDKTLTIRFTEATTGGNTVSDYKYSLDGGATYVSAGVTTSPVVLTGLTNGTPYTVKLKTVTAAGSSATASTVTATPVGAPGAPTITSITSPTGGKLSVSVTLNANSGGLPVSKYYYAIDGGSYREYSSFVSPLVLTGLTNNVTYSVGVKAYNAAGLSEASNTLTGTPIASRCSAPRDLAVSVGNAQLAISFSPPSDDGGDVISHYEYSLSGDGFDPAEYRSTNTSLPYFVITGLTNGVSYTVNLRAHNSLGAGVVATSASATPSTPPEAPTDLTLTSTYGDAGFDLTFTPPAVDGGSPVINYKYSLNGVDYVSADKTSGPIQILGLTSQSSYSITLRAVSAAGDGEVSAPITATALGLPNAPQIDSIAASNEALTVHFTNSTKAGGAAIIGHSYSIDGGSFINSSVSCSTLGGTCSFPIYYLTNERDYTIVLRANTADGPGQSSNAVTQAPGVLPTTPTLLNYSLTGKNSGTLIIKMRQSLGTSRVEASLDGGAWVTMLATTGLDPTQDNVETVSGYGGLTLGNNYSVRVRAASSVGASDHLEINYDPIYVGPYYRPQEMRLVRTSPQTKMLVVYMGILEIHKLSLNPPDTIEAFAYIGSWTDSQQQPTPNPSSYSSKLTLQRNNIYDNSAYTFAYTVDSIAFPLPANDANNNQIVAIRLSNSFGLANMPDVTGGDPAVVIYQENLIANRVPSPPSIDSFELLNNPPRIVVKFTPDAINTGAVQYSTNFGNTWSYFASTAPVAGSATQYIATITGAPTDTLLGLTLRGVNSKGNGQASYYTLLSLGPISVYSIAQLTFTGKFLTGAAGGGSLVNVSGLISYVLVSNSILTQRIGYIPTTLDARIIVYDALQYNNNWPTPTTTSTAYIQENLVFETGYTTYAIFVTASLSQYTTYTGRAPFGLVVQLLNAFGGAENNRTFHII